jgi:hypothetical protein
MYDSSIAWNTFNIHDVSETGSVSVIRPKEVKESPPDGPARKI